MFDDPQPGNAGQVPPNLPVGEPEDMFADTEASAPAAPASFASSADESAGESEMLEVTSPSAPATALDAGILRPKQPVTAPPPAPTIQPVGAGSVLPPQAGAAPQGEHEMYRIKEPSIGRGILVTVIVIVAAVIIGGGGWYLYQRFVLPPEPTGFNPEVAGDETDSAAAENTVPASAETAPVETGAAVPAETASSSINAEIRDQQILFGEPIDTDGDSLDDITETQIASDPKNWDTDADGLSDGDEVKIWRTDPLKKDTDSDGYADGVEVKSGYNPNGAGKLFQPPTTTMP